jgi:hypothetical protein
MLVASSLTLVMALASGCALPPRGTEATFRSDVLPVLRRFCWRCHGESVHESHLDLRTPGSILRGGDSGPAVVAGRPGDSLLVKLLVEEQMPPEGERPSTADISLISEWVSCLDERVPPQDASHEANSERSP